MIASLNGKVMEIRSDAVVVDVGGIGFLVFVPGSLLARIRTGENFFLILIWLFGKIF